MDEVEDRDGVKEITLVTCVDYNATERIIVKGIFKESKAYSETSEDILKAFNQPYRQPLLRMNEPVKCYFTGFYVNKIGLK